MRWPLIILAVFLGEALPIAALAVVIAFFGPSDPVAASDYANAMGAWIGPIGGALVVLLGARLVGSGAERPVAQGAVIGVAVAIIDGALLVLAGAPFAMLFVVSNVGKIVAGIVGGLWARGRSVTPAALAGLLVLGSVPLSGQDSPGEAGFPAPEHEQLAALAGPWTVHVEGARVGTATAAPVLDGRFVEFDLRAEGTPIRRALYTFGFDTRHGHFTVMARDESGPYWVTATGVADGSRIPMYGVDDDPVMASMGYVKEFVIELELRSESEIVIATRFIDNRTEARTELPFLSFVLTR